jgi:hypothetical protein
MTSFLRCYKQCHAAIYNSSVSITICGKSICNYRTYYPVLTWAVVFASSIVYTGKLIHCVIITQNQALMAEVHKKAVLSVIPIFYYPNVPPGKNHILRRNNRF